MIMMSERFVVETVMITDCCTDESRVVEVITDEQELHTYEELSEIKDLLNEQEDKIKELKSIIDFATDGEDLIIVLMKEIIRLRQENEDLPDIE